MSSHLTRLGMYSNLESLDRQQLLARLRMAESRCFDAQAEEAYDENLRNFHELQVHKVELEMQNRHMAETQVLLEDSRSKYAELYENCPAGLVTVSPPGRILRVNATTADMLGRSNQDLFDAVFSRFIVNEDRHHFTQLLHQCLIGHRRQKFEIEVSIWGIKAVKRMHLTMHLHEQFEDQPLGVAISMVDVSEQYRLNERVAFLSSVSEQFCKNLELGSAAEAIFNMAVPCLADMVAISYIGENLVDESRQYKNSVRCDQNLWSCANGSAVYDVLIQSKLSNVITQDAQYVEWSVGVNDSVFTEEQLCTVLRHNIARVQAWRLDRRGEVLGVFWLVWSGGKEQQELATSSVLHDFVHRAALSLDIVSLYQLAQGQIQARSDFLAIVAHDLRNPLSVICMRAERMLEDNKIRNAEFVKKSGEIITRCANRMGLLVRDLLDATSMDSNRLSMTPRMVAVKDIVEEDLSAHLALLASKNIDFELDIDDDAWVFCDPRRVNQVITNLIGNAVKCTESGGKIRLQAKVGEEFVEISIHDTGCGIDESDKARIFEPFWQAKQIKSTRHGIGLGLNICKKIVSASNGSMWLESEVNVGSTFYFTLPKEKIYGRDNSRTSLGGATILVVDDDEAYRDTMSEFLAEHGYKVCCAQNGRAALDWISANGAPSLILLDLQMPVMDGIAFLKARATDEILKPIPVTVLSAAVHELNVDTWAKTRVLWKMTPMQDVLRAIATVEESGPGC